MIGFAQEPLQGAMWTALDADASLPALVGDRIYDVVPEDTAYPYVVIGEFTEVPDEELGTHDSEAVTVTATLHIWDEDYGQGTERIHAIGAQLKEVLHRSSLAVGSLGQIDPILEFSQTLREWDDTEKKELRHLVQRYRFRFYEV